MNRFKKLIGGSVGATVALSMALAMGLSSNASAIACYQYDPSGNFQTSQTPVFNNICGDTAPLSSTQGDYPLGDEPNFVRIRPHGSDSPLGSNNPPLVDNLTSACNNGDKFDIWTYVHNDAMSQFNDNGNGTAVAHNVKLALEANQINHTGNNFHFSSTVSASNAATVSDSTTLNCNGQPVKLTLVAHSVHYNNDLNQTTYGNMDDSAVNSTTLLGSPVWMSGNVWGCWNYRTVVVYTVTVQKETPPPPTPQVTAMCDIFAVTASEDRKVTVNQFKFTAVNASFKNLVVNWGDSNSNTFTDSNSVVGQTHQFVQDNKAHQYEIIATVNFTDINGKPISSTNANCARIVKFTPNQPPTVIPPTNVCTGETTNVNSGTAAQGGNCSTNTVTTTSSSQTPPTTLVNTGPGSIAAIFAAATVAGAVAYRRLLARRLSRQ